MRLYADAQITANAVSANSVIAAANTNLRLYADAQITANAVSANAVITTANTNLRLYADAQITANAVSSNAVITAANTNLKLYTDAQITANLVSAKSYADGKVSSVSGTSGRISSSGGTTPIIDLSTSGVTAGTYGGTTQIPVVTIDTYGRATYAANVTFSGGATITDDTTTSASRYPLFADATSGTLSTAYTSSTDLTYNPATGTLSAVIFTSLSDRNVKDNIQVVTNALDTIKQLEGVSFSWKENGNKSYGVIAQDIEQVLPDVVQTNDAGLKTVDYQALSAFLIESIKELKTEIDTLKELLYNK